MSAVRRNFGLKRNLGVKSQSAASRAAKIGMNSPTDQKGFKGP